MRRAAKDIHGSMSFFNGIHKSTGEVQGDLPVDFLQARMYNGGKGPFASEIIEKNGTLCRYTLSYQ